MKLGLLVEPHPANWNDEGKMAGFSRNERMAVLGAALCIAFWDMRSTGTYDMIQRSNAHRIPVEVIDMHSALVFGPTLDFKSHRIAL